MVESRDGSGSDMTRTLTRALERRHWSAYVDVDIINLQRSVNYHIWSWVYTRRPIITRTYTKRDKTLTTLALLSLPRVRHQHDHNETATTMR